MAWLELKGTSYWIVYREGGRRVKFNTGIKDRATANLRLKEYNAARTLNMIQSKYVKAPDRLIDFNSALKLYLNHKTLSPSTTELYQLAAAHWVKSAGNLPLYRYTLESFSSFLSRLKEKNLSQNTLSIYTRALHALFDWSVKQKFITTNIIQRVPELHRDVHTIPQHDIDLLIKHASPKLSFIIEFLLYTGLRIGEAVALTWKDIDTKNELIKIYNQKKTRFETIPILKSTASLLSKHKPGPPDQKVFGYFTYNSVRLAWDDLHVKLIENLKLMSTYYNLHQLRKTCGTNLANAGVYQNELQKYMRHKSIVTTYKYYVRTDMQQIKARIDSLMPPTDAPKKRKNSKKTQ